MLIATAWFFRVECLLPPSELVGAMAIAMIVLIGPWQYRPPLLVAPVFQCRGWLDSVLLKLSDEETARLRFATAQRPVDSQRPEAR